METLATATARTNVREGQPTSPTIVRELLDHIDRLEREAKQP